MIRWIALLMLMALPAQAQNEQVVLGLSKEKIRITADFDGSELLIFGAIKREVAIEDGPPLHVVVAISGPASPLTVYQKAQRYGIWLNTDKVEIASAPSYYTIATSAPWSEVITSEEDKLHRISIPLAIETDQAATTVNNPQLFTDAVIRIREDEGLFQLLEGHVSIDEQTLFRTSLKMPSNLTEGMYSTRIFLTREGRIVTKHEAEIEVSKVGLERFLFKLSREQPVIYGVMTLLIAALAGWGASIAFRMMRSG